MCGAPFGLKQMPESIFPERILDTSDILSKFFVQAPSVLRRNLPFSGHLRYGAGAGSAALRARGAAAKRESGAIPELPRSGKQERTAH